MTSDQVMMNEAIDLENDFTQWMGKNNKRSPSYVKVLVNDLKAIGGYGHSKNKLYGVVEKLTGKKPPYVFSIDDVEQFKREYDIVLSIKDWDGKSDDGFKKIEAKCRQGTTRQDITKMKQKISQVKDKETKRKKTSSGSLSAALGKYEEFLTWRKTRFPGNPPATTANLNPHNLILFGPPGTGKTFTTVNKALIILGIDFSSRQDAKKNMMKK